MSDYTKPFEKRLHSKFQTEKAAIMYFKEKNIHCVKIGLDYLPKGVKSIWIKDLPPPISKLPDLLVFHPKKRYLMECKGGINNVKIKLNDFKGYSWWNKIMDQYKSSVVYFITSINTKKIYLINHCDLNFIIKNNNYSLKEYPENNQKYYEIPFTDFKRSNEEYKEYLKKGCLIIDWTKDIKKYYIKSRKKNEN